MSEHSKIEWTEHSFNPWWGCQKVSEACRNCYAETFSKRVGQKVWGPPSTTSRRLFGDKHWAEPLKWDAKAKEAGERHRVFCASMADVFEDHPDVWNERNRLWDLIAETDNLIWLLLTKRPENIANMVPDDWQRHQWPDNVWVGTTVEDQENADVRVPLLLSIPAPVRFLSCEPLLGPLRLAESNIDVGYINWLRGFAGCEPAIPRIDWVITGGESGPHFRTPDPDWFRALRDQCVEAGVPFFFKQWSGLNPKALGRLLDGRTWDEYPVTAAAPPLSGEAGQ